jgi:hypothetical protein
MAQALNILSAAIYDNPAFFASNPGFADFNIPIHP